MSSSRSIVLLLCLLACNAGLAQSLRRGELSFSGTTWASEPVIRDVMKNVMEVGDDEFNCDMPDSVIAEVLPEDFQPAVAEAMPEDAGMPVYERWAINFCGREVPFLLTFWTMAHGGTAFDLAYPYEDVVSAAEEGTTRLQ